jgi:hypothetical protein
MFCRPTRLCLLKFITENIQMTKSRKYFSRRVACGPMTACWPTLVVPDKRKPERLKSSSKALVWTDYSAPLTKTFCMFGMYIYTQNWIVHCKRNKYLLDGPADIKASTMLVIAPIQYKASYPSFFLTQWMFPKCSNMLNSSYKLSRKPRGGVVVYL